ncbi:unnamed protein product, partial [Effrenium voratum]
RKLVSCFAVQSWPANGAAPPVLPMEISVLPQEQLASRFHAHLETLLGDFTELQHQVLFLSQERSQLERELATLRGETGAKAGGPPGNQKPIAPPLQPVALRESTPPDCESYQSNDIQELSRGAGEPGEEKEERQMSDVSGSFSGPHMKPALSFGQVLKIVAHTGPVFIIVMNTLAMGIAVDNYPASPAWAYLELFFALCYLLEFHVKVRHLGLRGYFCGQDARWNIFDFFCLLLSVSDVMLVFLVMAGAVNFSIGSASVIKVARLARLLRVIRTLSFDIFADLRLILLGVLSGLRVLFWAIVLLLLLIYVFGIGMATIADAEDEFSTLPASMFTIFRCLTEGCTAYDGTPLPEKLRRNTFANSGGLFMISYILVFMLVSVGLFHLIMAIFLDNVSRQQTLRKQKELAETALKTEVAIKRAVVKVISEEDDLKTLPDGLEKWDLKYQNKVLEKALASLDVTVTRDRFSNWLDYQDFVDTLEFASVDTSIRIQLFDILDADTGGLLSIDELITGLMSMRGHVTKGDIIAMSLKVRYVSQLVESVSRCKLLTGLQQLQVGIPVFILDVMAFEGKFNGFKEERASEERRS